jgi:hypothetical protein
VFRSSSNFPSNEDAPGGAAVLASAVVSADLTNIAALRQAPGGGEGPKIPARFLLQADEQTIVGLSAVLRAIAKTGKSVDEFRDWGAIGAPRFAGRSVGAVTVPKFKSGGAAVISPHFISQLSLHSLSGAISVALGMKGPNLGVGGGPNNVGEALLAALSMLETTDAPGYWLVASQWSPELVVDAEGKPIGPPAICHAVAIALLRSDNNSASLRLVRDETQRLRIAGQESRDSEKSSVLALAKVLAGASRGSTRLPAFSGWSFEIGAATVQERRAA